MKATTKLLAVAALAAGGTLAALDVQAQSPTARGARGSAAMPRSAGVDAGGRSWSGNHGNWSGGGHWNGGRWHGSRYWGPRWSFYFGVPVFWGGYYWGAPYWYDSYPGTTVIYREVEREASFPEGRIVPPTTEIPRGDALPSQGPLYMNYCESAKAYFPKVTTCPEGWKLKSPTQ